MTEIEGPLFQLINGGPSFMPTVSDKTGQVDNTSSQVESFASDDNWWGLRGACNKYPDDFNPWIDPDEFSQADVNKAKEICRKQCPVKLDCLNAAWGRSEKYGIWGGFDYGERQRLRRRYRNRTKFWRYP